mmetsp:Transcript_7058/g.13815  ORF Transcript_7058/g.13815 Transcript_7058/m.13815 type:complete len:434 (+) Transcript_7058:1650-2951(+)|eukprot:CAMPEP_0178715946 /NCGR_PEP_ID=MMETSP0699-20121125/20984_1 /TAXON_ID=265572 /ORGANISM="Extubocellulus spinifer, Strain CCMP396" /LENGTH=433 /DNA_ID=CAMNT_0020365393 /DNA_START=2134 /DNA_END=3435 /DNA_ORIENTATION=+
MVRHTASIGSQKFTLALLLLVNAVFCLTESQIENFRRDGYLYVPRFFEVSDTAFRDLLLAKAELIRQQQQKSATDGSFFSVIETGMVFGNSDQTCDAEEQSVNNVRQAFRDIALRSSLVEASAQLMEIDRETETMRLLRCVCRKERGKSLSDIAKICECSFPLFVFSCHRDVFLVKPVQTETYCDWHVDDLSFWPQSFVSSRSNSHRDGVYLSSGINVWLGMDDMPIERGGSMAVARGSHMAQWRFDAHRAIGQDRTIDTNLTKDGLAEYLTTVAVTNSTCGISKSDPLTREKIEESKVTFDIHKGDVIFADRELFHRTIATTEEGRQQYLAENVQSLSRYSIRYVAGSSRLPLGFSLEPSIVTNSANSGRALDDVVESDSDMWCPEVWPDLPEDIDSVLEEMGRTRLAEAKAMVATTIQEFSAILKKMKTQS